MKSSKKMKNDKVCIYSPDADIYVLSLISNKNNVYKFNNQKDIDTGNTLLNKFEYMNIDEYKNHLLDSIVVNTSVENFCQDYNLMMCFCGNDFIKSFMFSKSKDRYTYNKILMPTYEGIYNKLKKNLIEIKGNEVIINNEFFKMFIEHFAVNEDSYYKNYYFNKIDKVMSGKTYNNNNNKYKNKFDEMRSMFEHTLIHSRKNKILYKKYIKNLQKLI